jgi:thiamine pyrophosphate-dependent acetolactate synthase large subunit-like protein
MGNVRWDHVAEGLGCEGLFVDTRDALAPAIERAHKSTAPIVLCVKIDRDASMAVPEEPGLRIC